MLPILRALFGQRVERSSLSGINDYGDFINVPFLIEAKSTAKPMFQTWARTCERKAGRAWAIIWKGDTRVKTGNGPYVLTTLALFEELVNMAIDGNREEATVALQVLNSHATGLLGGKK